MGHPLVDVQTRRHAVSLLQKGHTYAEAAEILQIGYATVNRIWREFRHTGAVTQPKRKGGRFSSITPKDESGLITLIRKNSDWTVDKITAAWCKMTGKKASRSSMLRKLKAIGFTRKKKSLQASQKKTKKNAAKQSSFRFLRKALPLEKLVFLDESGFQSTLARPDGWALRGERLQYYAPVGFSRNYTMVGAIRATGPVIMSGSQQNMTIKRFCSFLRQKLLPRLHPGDILLMDNLPVHRNKLIRRICKLWSVRVIYLPPYCPEYNPIEKVWSWMKARLRRRLNRLSSSFRYAVAGAWRKAANLDMCNLLASSGYVRSCEVI